LEYSATIAVPFSPISAAAIAARMSDALVRGPQSRRVPRQSVSFSENPKVLHSPADTFRNLCGSESSTIA